MDTVIVFTADGCPHCAALIDDLRRRGVRYREINLSREPEQMQRLRQLSWEHRLPVVVDHELVSIGYRGGSSRYAELGLEQHGFPAVMVTDTAFFRNPNYHQPSDTPQTLDYQRMVEVVRGVYAAMIGL